MYREQPYPFPQQPPLRPVRRMNVQRNNSFRYILICVGGLCTVIIVGILITVLVLYFVRYRNRISSALSYPDFICNQRPCGCPTYKQDSSVVTKIVGGKDALPFSYPWLVALVDRYTTDSFCAGFIISPNAILTAAHCVNGRNINQVQILTKAHDLRQFTGDRYDIDRWFIHSDYRYNDSMHLNDIALIRVKQSFDVDLQPCCLPAIQSTIYPRAQTRAVVSGWGKLLVNVNSRSSPVLQHVVMPVVDEKSIKCRTSLVDPSRQLCAGYDSLRIDTCSGDSGSPLLVVEYDDRNKGHFVATGIVSYGNRQCDTSISSGVYTRVGFYLPWIRNILATS